MILGQRMHVIGREFLKGQYSFFCFEVVLCFVNVYHIEMLSISLEKHTFLDDLTKIPADYFNYMNYII